MSDGRPREFCRAMTTIVWRGRDEPTVLKTGPHQFHEVYMFVGEQVEEAVFDMARRTTGDVVPASIGTCLYDFHVECTE